MVSRISWSGQSSICTVAVSGEPPSNTWTIAWLTPASRGPPCRKECPIIRPATRNRSLSTRNCDEDGTRWPVSPSKRQVLAVFTVLK